jgi:hypothetical protein
MFNLVKYVSEIFLKITNAMIRYLSVTYYKYYNIIFLIILLHKTPIRIFNKEKTAPCGAVAM